MSTPNPLEAPAIQAAIVVVKQVQLFFASVLANPDPVQIAAKLPGAAAVFLGNVEQQAPALVGAEIGGVNAAIQQRTNAWLASLEAKLAATPGA
jgi:hypothetical protein